MIAIRSRHFLGCILLVLHCTTKALYPRQVCGLPIGYFGGNIHAALAREIADDFSIYARNIFAGNPHSGFSSKFIF